MKHTFLQVWKKIAILSLTGLFLLTPYPAGQQSVQAAPLKDGGPIIGVVGECEPDMPAIFTVTNTGDPMTFPYSWTIKNNGMFIGGGDISLNPYEPVELTKDFPSLWGDSSISILDDGDMEVASATAHCPAPTFTPTPSDTSTSTSTSTPTDTPTPTSTYTPTETVTPTLTFTPTFTPTDTLTPTNTLTPSETPTLTNTVTNVPTSTPTHTATNTLTPTLMPTATRTLTPTQTLVATFTPTIKARHDSPESEEESPIFTFFFPWTKAIATMAPTTSPTMLPSGTPILGAKVEPLILMNGTNLPAQAAALPLEERLDLPVPKPLLPMIGFGSLCTGILLSVLYYSLYR